MSKETKIEPFKPQNLEAGVSIQPFRPKSFTNEAINAKAHPSMNQEVRGNKSGFALHPASKKLLGVEDAENNEIEEAVNAEVQSRLQQLRDQAYQEGFDKGMTDGKAQAEVEFLSSIKPLYDQFQALCTEYDQIKHDLYVANEQFLVQLMFQFGKHILLKELSTDPEYIKRIASLMIEKIGAKDHVKLKISRQDFANMEQVRDYLKGQFPDLKNIQIEVSDDLVLGGCKVETDLARINASVETQLKSIEKSLSEA